MKTLIALTAAAFLTMPMMVSAEAHAEPDGTKMEMEHEGDVTEMELDAEHSGEVELDNPPTSEQLQQLLEQDVAIGVIQGLVVDIDDEGVVTLNGTVSDGNAGKNAEAAVEDLDGVTEVVNHISD